MHKFFRGIFGEFSGYYPENPNQRLTKTYFHGLHFTVTTHVMTPHSFVCMASKCHRIFFAISFGDKCNTQCAYVVLCWFLTVIHIIINTCLISPISKFFGNKIGCHGEWVCFGGSNFCTYFGWSVMQQIRARYART